MPSPNAPLPRSLTIRTAYTPPTAATVGDWLNLRSTRSKLCLSPSLRTVLGQALRCPTPRPTYGLPKAPEAP
jgi:hypothetical protein